MHVIVGSTNPTKISATHQAFAAVWPDQTWEVTGLNVPSGVADQPMSDQESIKGATNRAQAVMAKESPDFAVGLEGGLQQIDSKWFDCGWIVILDRHGHIGIASSARMHTPPQVMKLIHEGVELGQAMDQLFNLSNSKHAQGHFGLMTNNLVTREKGYLDAVIFALASFIHPNIFD
jgi:inosine/xanthosine triphosphatase